KKPIVSILLATLVGAFSPFCSCSVIPIIASLLIGGVPLSPVMSFWLASPSMDPEIFFLSVSVLGWNLAVWRLGSAFAMSLSAGLITQILVKKAWIREDATLKAYSYGKTDQHISSFKDIISNIKKKYLVWNLKMATAEGGSVVLSGSGCCSTGLIQKESIVINRSKSTATKANKQIFLDKLIKEIIKATTMVVKFMLLAYFLEALIILYLPAQFIQSLLGTNHFLSIVGSALIGIPVYTSSIPALALVGGLIGQGMAPAAGLAFLIAGPTTTIPAMAAVWNLADRKVFSLYVGFTLAAAVISGLLYHAFS
ncbi:MAG: permease, partial [Bacteroidetes bacterium]|nr:permease [Bacteroidota bacterium]